MFVLKREVLSTTLILVEGTFCTDRRIAQGASDCVRIYTRHACRAAEHFDARGSRRLLVACGRSAQGQCDVPALEGGLTYTYVAAGGLHTVLLRSDGEPAIKDLFDKVANMRAPETILEHTPAGVQGDPGRAAVPPPWNTRVSRESLDGSPLPPSQR